MQEYVQLIFNHHARDHILQQLNIHILYPLKLQAVEANDGILDYVSEFLNVVHTFGHVAFHFLICVYLVGGMEVLALHSDFIEQ